MTAAQPRRAVFLDRDGTLAEEVGYVNHPSRFRLFPFAAPAIRRLNQAGLLVMVVTNQSGVARGFFPESLVRQVNDLMVRELSSAGARIDGVYYCPHRVEDLCGCRKPRPGMLERAALEHDLRLPDCYLVSDLYADLEMGRSEGCRSILVCTGYGRGEYEWNRGRWPRPPDFVAEDLSAAVEWILKEAQ